MNFEHYLTQQTQIHPATQPQDITKQCYQAAFGAEHLLADPDRALRYLIQEYETIQPADLPLYEVISHRICRVNLAAWKAHGLPIGWLFRMFLASASAVSPTFDPAHRHRASSDFDRYLDTANNMIHEKVLPVSFSTEDWDQYLAEYRTAGTHAVHHSDVYRRSEQPAYRILQRQFLRLLPVLRAVAAFSTSPVPSTSSSPFTSSAASDHAATPLIIAIDGRAASGKTTMADQLADILDADVIRMDDFFLPPTLRTPKRLQTPGGNVHYERFIEEVLPHLRSRDPFSYRRFDCHIMDYHGVRQISQCITDHQPIRIVEGSYSCHPALGDYADITVFSTVEPEAQMQRILQRNGAEMAKVFASRWIPMEESYFQEHRIEEQHGTLIIDSHQWF